jgi:hypothetical protein
LHRGVAAACFILLLTTACPSEQRAGPATSTPRAWIEGLPPLIVFDGPAVWRQSERGREELYELPNGTVALALAAPDEGLIIEREQGGGGSDIVRIVGGRFDEVVVRRERDVGSTLFDAANIGGVASIVYGVCDEVEGSNEGDIFVRELASGRDRSG